MSTKPPEVLKTDIRRALDLMHVHYRETKTGFDCIYLPSIDIMTSSLRDPRGTLSPMRYGLRAPASHQQQPYVSPPLRWSVADPRVFASAGQNTPWNTPSIRFEINIVKVRTLSFLRLLSHLVDLASILISFLGPTVAVT